MAASVPWILGARGAPLEAPENTRAGFATALALGLDGIATDLRSCGSGEIVVTADLELERTTDGHGLVAEKPWTELAGLDAGAAFHARFRGERLLLAEELLALSALHGPASSLVARAHGPEVVARFADLAREIAPRASVRLAATERETVLAARDAGLRKSPR
ncbi:MAG: glycerophosphodiester phosphodiesterase family protein [Planctomycetota bacterium]|nr:glycerophosphodiester phosphodiesterase family protein [Planctomycetota bacterium]